MSSIPDQHREAGRIKDAIRNGTHSDEGGPAPSSADHALIATVREALTMLEPRPSPNGIGYTATSISEVARIIRDTATWTSCAHCGLLSTHISSAACDCVEADG